MSCGCAALSSASARGLTAGASGTGGARGSRPLPGVLIRLTSWLPGGFGGGAGDGYAYMAQ